MSAPAADRAAGESLVELLVAMVVLGITVTGILGALLVTTQASGQHRRQVQAQNALRGWAEQVSAAAYTDCAVAGSIAAPSPALPAGFTATVTAVRYWNGTAFVASCTTGADAGIQRVSLRVTATASPYPAVSQNVDVVLRKPCVSSC